MSALTMVGRGEAKAMAIDQAKSISNYYQEGVGLPSNQTLHC